MHITSLCTSQEYPLGHIVYEVWKVEGGIGGGEVENIKIEKNQTVHVHFMQHFYSI